MTVDAARAIDLERYPIHEPGSRRYGDLIRSIHADLAHVGCAKLDGFIKSACCASLKREADRVAGFAHRSFNLVNPYFTADDTSLGASHPRRRFERRSNAFVPGDRFGDDSLLRAIYRWQPFTDLIRIALGEEEGRFHRYDDPLADVIINVVEPGDGFPWHFDTNTYTVTLGIHPGDGGGLFQYCPNLRAEGDENYAGVAAVLDGDLSPVHSLRLAPGDLQIFLGRYSLHRVTAVEGASPRYVGIFSYADEPGMCGRVERTRQLYGRVLPIHLEREARHRQDSLAD